MTKTVIPALSVFEKEALGLPKGHIYRERFRKIIEGLFDRKDSDFPCGKIPTITRLLNQLENKMRSLGTVFGSDKADALLGKLRVQYVDAQFNKEPADSTPGRFRINMVTDTLKVGESKVADMERLVNENK